jgi:hypothetical protein
VELNVPYLLGLEESIGMRKWARAIETEGELLEEDFVSQVFSLYFRSFRRMEFEHCNFTEEQWYFFFAPALFTLDS